MSAVSVNEGKLEAINTYDNSFLTFGCFQWTVGADDAAGELPAMVNLLKQTDAAAFNQLLGQFGLDVASVNSSPGQTPTGFFSLNGAVIKSAADKKNKLRTLEMAFRFFSAGQDKTMRQAEVEYAASRIDLFYRDSNHKIRNLFIADFVSSEFGVALILDEHVNRRKLARDELVVRAVEDDLPVVQVSWDDAVAYLEEAGVPLKADREQAWRDFAGWRINYDAVLLALANLTSAPPAPWSSDRSGARPMRPRLFGGTVSLPDDAR
jgi:hypothetical protein